MLAFWRKIWHGKDDKVAIDDDLTLLGIGNQNHGPAVAAAAAAAPEPEQAQEVVDPNHAALWDMFHSSHGDGPRLLPAPVIEATAADTNVLHTCAQLEARLQAVEKETAAIKAALVTLRGGAPLPVTAAKTPSPAAPVTPPVAPGVHDPERKYAVYAYYPSNLHIDAYDRKIHMAAKMAVPWILPFTNAMPGAAVGGTRDISFDWTSMHGKAFTKQEADAVCAAVGQIAGVQAEITENWPPPA